MYFGRGQNKIQEPYTLPDMYKDYSKRIEEGSPYDIPYSLYRDITILYNKKILDRLYQGLNVRLPYRIGSIQIIKKKMYFKTQKNKLLGIDWKSTNKYGKLIHHLNEHSDGYKFLFYWERKSSRLRNVKLYRLVPTRTVKRTLAKLIKEDKRDYFEV